MNFKIKISQVLRLKWTQPKKNEKIDDQYLLALSWIEFKHKIGSFIEKTHLFLLTKYAKKNYEKTQWNCSREIKSKAKGKNKLAIRIKTFFMTI